MGASCTRSSCRPCESDFSWRCGYELDEGCQNKRNFQCKGCYECDDADSRTSDRLSSDLGDTRHHGPPIRPAVGGRNWHWVRTIIVKIRRKREREDWSSEELGRGVGRAARDYISEVRESSLLAPLCDCLTSPTHGGFRVVTMQNCM